MILGTLTFAAGCISTPEPQRNDDRGEDAGAFGLPACPPRVDTPTGPAGQASVANYPGTFSYSAQSLAKTGLETFVWTNPTGGAQVSWGGQSATGAMTLTLKDECGAEIYKQEFTAMSQGGAYEVTQRAAPGEWWIELDFAAYTGQVGLSITSA